MKVTYVLVLAVALLLTGFTTAALADLISESLGTSINATDIWSVQCGAGTTTVRANVDDDGGLAGDGVRMKVTVLDLRGRSVSATSPDNGAVTASLSGGPGQYLVLIQKGADIAQATVESYDGSISCRNALNVEVVTQLLLVQDQ